MSDHEKQAVDGTAADAAPAKSQSPREGTPSAPEEKTEAAPREDD